MRLRTIAAAPLDFLLRCSWCLVLRSIPRWISLGNGVRVSTKINSSPEGVSPIETFRCVGLKAKHLLHASRTQEHNFMFNRNWPTALDRSSRIKDMVELVYGKLLS